MTGASRAQSGDRPCVPYVGRTMMPRASAAASGGGVGTPRERKAPRATGRAAAVIELVHVLQYTGITAAAAAASVTVLR